MTQFRRELKGVVPLSRTLGGAPAASFAHSLPLSPARIGFNLEEAVSPPPDGAEYAHASHVRRFRGRVVADLDDGTVHVRIGEIPSGRSAEVMLPREWFPEGMPLHAHRPFLLVTWGGEGEQEHHQVEDDGVSEETPDGAPSRNG